jgi:hypothetical protein
MRGVDVLGTVSRVVDGEPSPTEGWLVNVTPAVLAANPALADFVVTPSRLARVWAGDDPESPTMTVALRFADEAEALANFPTA